VEDRVGLEEEMRSEKMKMRDDKSMIDYRIGNVTEEEEGIHFSLMRRRRRRQDANILGKAGKFSRKLDSGSLPFAARIRLSLSIFVNLI
jgi:hypothetical protein